MQSVSFPEVLRHIRRRSHPGRYSPLHHQFRQYRRNRPPRQSPSTLRRILKLMVLTSMPMNVMHQRSERIDRVLTTMRSKPIGCQYDHSVVQVAIMTAGVILAGPLLPSVDTDHRQRESLNHSPMLTGPSRRKSLRCIHLITATPDTFFHELFFVLHTKTGKSL